MNKKITVVVLLIVALCAVLTPVLAQEPITLESLQAQIDTLIAEIETLKAQIAALTPNAAADAPSQIAPVQQAGETGNYPLLGAEYKKISDLTDFQKESYLQNMVGQEYRVVGKITDVESNGSIQLDLVDSTFFAISQVEGYPYDQLLNLKKGDEIDFIGRVIKSDTFLYLMITTEFVRDAK